MEKLEIAIPFSTEILNYLQSKCYLQGTMLMQRILYWRNQT